MHTCTYSELNQGRQCFPCVCVWLSSHRRCLIGSVSFAINSSYRICMSVGVYTPSPATSTVCKCHLNTVIGRKPLDKRISVVERFTPKDQFLPYKSSQGAVGRLFVILDIKCWQHVGRDNEWIPFFDCYGSTCILSQRDEIYLNMYSKTF